MRKEFVYSMLALTAAPGAAYAVVVDVNLPTAQQISDSKWTGDPTISEGTVLVAEGAYVSQNIGVLLPGTYELKIEKLVSVECDLKVNFGGQTKTIKKGSTNATLQFTLSAEQNVDLTITSAEAKRFELSQVTLVLKFDFDAYYDVLNDANVKVSSLISQITSGYGKQIDGQEELLGRAQVIQKKVDEVKNSQNYATYQTYALYLDASQNSIMADIKALEADAKKAVNKWYVEQLKAKLGEVYDGESSDVKRIVASTYNNIVKDINTFDNNDVVDDKEYQALLAKIDDGNDANNKDLKDKIRLANSTAASLLAAYNDVKDYIDGVNAYATQWAQSDGVTYGSAYDIYTDINAQLQILLKDNKYKNILAAAQKDLSHSLQKVTQAEKDNEAAYAALSYQLGGLEYGLQSKLKSDVDAAVAEMLKFYTTYQTTKAQFDNLLGRYETVNAYLASVKATHAVGLSVSQIKSKLDAAQKAVDALKKAFDDANVTTDGGVIVNTMADLYNNATNPTYLQLENAANNAIKSLNDTAAPYTAHQNSISNANSDKAWLDNNWTNVKSTAANYNYDGDKVSGYFGSTISGIESSITSLQNAINSAKNSGKWNGYNYSYNTTFYSSTLASTISSIQGSYNKYNTEAKAAQDNYNYVVNSSTPEGLKRLQARLDGINNIVKDLAIYNDLGYNYADKVVKIQAKIDAVWAKINKPNGAKSKWDYNHSDAMKAVTLDSSIASDLQWIENNYEADNKALEAAMKAAMLAATASSYDKLVDDILSLNGDRVKYGLSYDAIDRGRKSIRDEEADLLFGLDKTKAKTAIDGADSEGLAEIQENIQTIREKLDELLSVAIPAAELVKANQEAQAALLISLADLDKYYTDKITNDALVNNATALADETVTPVKNVNKEMETTIPADIAKLKALIGTDDYTGTDRKTEKLADNKAKHEQTIASIKARIDAALKEAKAMTANYNKYQEYTAATGKIAVTQTALNDAVAKANAADPANADYKDKSIVKAQQNNLNDATYYSNQYYKGGTMVANAQKIQDYLDGVKAFADGLEAKAKANKKAYDEMVAEWAAVKTLWTSVSTDIAKFDESSQREKFQQMLKAELDKLNKNKTDYENNYKAIGLPNNDLVATLAAIKNAINDIRYQSLDPDNYKANIKADNDNMLEIIKATVNAAAKEYDLDTDTLKMFKNATSTVLTTSLGVVQTQYDLFNNTLYKYVGASTFVEIVNAKYKNAVKVYGETVSPDVFDKDSLYLKNVTFNRNTQGIRLDIDELVKARVDFMTAIRAAIAAETKATIDDYQAQINAVISELKALKGYTSQISDAKAKATVKTQSDDLAAARDAVAAGLIPEIDAAFAKLENITADLAAAKFATMREKLDADIKLAEAYVKKGKEYLADDPENLALFTAEASAVTSARSSYNAANTAAKLTDAKYNEIENLLVNFKANGNNTYEKVLANNTAWPKIQGYVATALKTVQDAINGVKDYAAAGQVQQVLEDYYRTLINAQYDGYEELYQTGMLRGNHASTANTVLNNSNNNVKNNIVKTSGNGSVLYLFEAAIIKDNLDELQAEYNKFAASSLTDITESEKVKKEIESIKTSLGTYTNQTVSYNDADGNSHSYSGGKWSGKSNASDLLAIQKQITTLLNKLLEANYGQGVSDAAALAELQADFAAVKNAFNKANYTEEELAYADGEFENGTPFVNPDLNAEIAQLEAAIKAIEDDLAGSSVYYKRESIAEKIAAALSQAQALKAQADQNKKNLDKVKIEFNTAYAKLLTTKGQTPRSIADQEGLIKAAKAELDANIYDEAQAASFANMFGQLEQEVAAQKSAIEGAKEAGVLQTTSQFAQLKADLGELEDYLIENLYDIKNTAANRELVAEVEDLQSQLDKISYDVENYTLASQKLIAKQKTAINEAINGTFNKGALVKNGLVQDIAAAKMQDYELVNGIAVDPTTLDLTASPIVADPVTTSYVYLKKNGLKYGGLVTDVQGMIDDLNDFIKDNKINPDPVVPGDITGTGVVEYNDVKTFINDLLTDNLPDGSNADDFARYDANGDGEIDIADAQAIMNLYLGLNADGTDPNAAGVRGTAAKNLAATYTTQAVQMENGISRILFNINSDTDFTGFQMDVNLAEGMEVSAATAEGFELRSNNLTNGKLRIVSFGDTRISANGTVLALDVIGNGNVSFGNIVFTTDKAQSVKLAAGNATAISSIEGDQENSTVYSISGRIANGVKKGVNIVRDALGNAKKVIRK